jgi:hypothetical protein
VAAREWVVILQRSWPEIRTILLNDSAEGTRLRQNDPFCGILTPVERWKIYREAASSPFRKRNSRYRLTTDNARSATNRQPTTRAPPGARRFT